jgi:hypothetical protein
LEILLFEGFIMRTTRAALVAALLIVAASSARAYDAYRYWAGPAYVSDSYGYSTESVPYYVRNPPVYYGYSMLLPVGEGFTMRSYSPDAAQTLSVRKPPLLLVNPYVTAAADSKPSKPKPAAKPSNPKVKKASLQLVAQTTPVRNPFVTP